MSNYRLDVIVEFMLKEFAKTSARIEALEESTALSVPNYVIDEKVKELKEHLNSDHHYNLFDKTFYAYELNKFESIKEVVEEAIIEMEFDFEFTKDKLLAFVRNEIDGTKKLGYILAKWIALNGSEPEKYDLPYLAFRYIPALSDKHQALVDLNSLEKLLKTVKSPESSYLEARAAYKKLMKMSRPYDKTVASLYVLLLFSKENVYIQ